jgi:hypothetical protein
MHQFFFSFGEYDGLGIVGFSNKRLVRRARRFLFAQALEQPRVRTDMTKGVMIYDGSYEFCVFSGTSILAGALRLSLIPKRRSLS